jgi:hypothetical protein
MNNIHWPAIIQYDNDPELEYLENESALKLFAEASDNIFEENDRLIDSEGRLYHFSKPDYQPSLLTFSGESVSLEMVLGMVKAHLADSGSCCVAKAYAPTIRDAIRMVTGNECRID